VELATGSGAEVVDAAGSACDDSVSASVESDELAPAMLPMVFEREPTEPGLHELGPELHPMRRLAMSDA